MPAPANPKIYHIVHIDKLASIVADGHIWCDKEMAQNPRAGTIIGMRAIKQHRMTNALESHVDLTVGQCVPFYFCPRSVMLYLISRQNHPQMTYTGGQGPIVHLEADLNTVVNWAEDQGHRWAFTLSNAGSNYFEDRCDLNQLDEINWDAVGARQWAGSGISGTVKESKQAEFLVERSFPWNLVERIGVKTRDIAQQATFAVQNATNRPTIEVKQNWYY